MPGAWHIPAAMKHIRLGKTDLLVSSIGLGCVTFGREIDESKALEIMDHSLSRGINLFDTAAAYSERASETIIGRWFKARGARDRVVLATKINRNMSRDSLLASVDQSLQSLQTDRIDLFQLHHWPDAAHPLDEVLEALDHVVRQGKVRFLGVSNAAAWQLCKALWRQDVNGWARFESVQPPYNLVQREIEQELLPLCADQEIGVISYSPLGAGFLAGKYRAGGPIPKGTRFDVAPGHQDIYFKPDNFALVERLRAASDQSGIPMTELALNWVMKQKGVTSVLVGARTTEQVDQAMRAESLQADFGWL